MPHCVCLSRFSNWSWSRKKAEKRKRSSEREFDLSLGCWCQTGNMNMEGLVWRILNICRVSAEYKSKLNKRFTLQTKIVSLHWTHFQSTQEENLLKDVLRQGIVLANMILFCSYLSGNKNIYRFVNLGSSLLYKNLTAFICYSKHSGNDSASQLGWRIGWAESVSSRLLHHIPHHQPDNTDTVDANTVHLGSERQITLRRSKCHLQRYIQGLFMVKSWM